MIVFFDTRTNSIWYCPSCEMGVLPEKNGSSDLVIGENKCKLSSVFVVRTSIGCVHEKVICAEGIKITFVRHSLSDAFARFYFRYLLWIQRKIAVSNLSRKHWMKHSGPCQHPRNEPFELGYSKLLVISNRIGFPWSCHCFIIHALGLPKLPLSTCFSLAQINPPTIDIFRYI